MKNQNKKRKLEVPKRTARRKLFTPNEELEATVCATCGERVEHGNELRCDDCKKCMMSKA